MSTRSSASTWPRKKPESAPRTLTPRDLNRALLARQLLLERSTLGPLQVIERLAGMQAQVPRPPFLGLWTRLAAFERADLHALLTSKQAVRATMMRGTIHLVSTADFRVWRPALQPALTSIWGSLLKDRVDGIDLAKLTAFARSKLPSNFATLRTELVKKFPKHDDRALGFSVRIHLPLVMVPTATKWSFPGNADFACAKTYLGRGVETGSLTDLVRRYLAAFGPASIRDAMCWSGIRKTDLLAPTFEALRPELVTFRDDRGRELFDLPDAPRPSADVPAPVRLIPEYDNLVLGHDDRSRIIDDAHRSALVTKNLVVPATFLVDGRVAGTWTSERTKKRATLTLAPFGKLAKPTKAVLEAEADALLRWTEDDATEFAISWKR